MFAGVMADLRTVCAARRTHPRSCIPFRCRRSAGRWLQGLRFLRVLSARQTHDVQCIVKLFCIERMGLGKGVVHAENSAGSRCTWPWQCVLVSISRQAYPPPPTHPTLACVGSKEQ